MFDKITKKSKQAFPLLMETLSNFSNIENMLPTHLKNGEKIFSHVKSKKINLLIGSCFSGYKIDQSLVQKSYDKWIETYIHISREQIPTDNFEIFIQQTQTDSDKFKMFVCMQTSDLKEVSYEHEQTKYSTSIGVTGFSNLTDHDLSFITLTALKFQSENYTAERFFKQLFDDFEIFSKDKKSTGLENLSLSF